MAFTSEQLDDYPLCGAKKKNGEVCRMWAGAGTDHKGMGRCKWHLGNTENHRMHAVRQEAMQNAAVASMEVTPGQAIRAVLHDSAGTFAWLTAMAGALTEEQMVEQGIGGARLNMWIRLRAEEGDRLAQIAKTAAAMGLDERQVQMSERMTAMMGSLLEAVMDKIDLTPKQREAMGPAIRESLPMLMGRNADPDKGSAAAVADDRRASRPRSRTERRRRGRSGPAAA